MFRRAVARAGFRVVGDRKLIVARLVLFRRLVSVACLFMRHMVLVDQATNACVTWLSSTVTYGSDLGISFRSNLIGDDVCLLLGRLLLVVAKDDDRYDSDHDH